MCSRSLVDAIFFGLNESPIVSSRRDSSFLSACKLISPSVDFQKYRWTYTENGILLSFFDQAIVCWGSAHKHVSIAIHWFIYCHFALMMFISVVDCCLWMLPKLHQDLPFHLSISLIDDDDNDDDVVAGADSTVQ